MAKLDSRRAEAVLAEPGNYRVILLHGDDPGLVREQSDRLVHSVTGGDALRLTELPREALKDVGVLAAEASSLPLTGGRCVVRVRDATDAATAAAKAALAGKGPGVVVLEAPELSGKGRLKTLLDAAPEAAVIACYRERGAELAGSIGRILAELGVSATSDAMQWLAQRLGEDRMLLRRELEKLAAYVGSGGRVEQEDAVACIAEGSALDLEEAIIAALAGDVPAADLALATAFAEGVQAVQVVRTVLRHLQRLQLAAQSVADGRSPGDALAELRPPVFFRHRPTLERALRRWPTSSLAAAADAFLVTERRTKTTGLPDATVARQAVLTLARQAAARRQ